MSRRIPRAANASSEPTIESARRHWIVAIVLIAAAAGLPGCSSAAVDDADRLNGFQLMKAATAAHEAGRTEEAGFLAFAELTRFEIDFDVYPAVEKGNDNPRSKAAINSLIIGPITEQLKKDPTAFANANKRFAKWAPKFDVGYDPGWKHSKALGGDEAKSVAAATHSAMVQRMEVELKLLTNAEYGRLKDEVAEATTVEEQYKNAARESSVVNPVADKITEAFLDAQNKKYIASRRMKQIEWDVEPKSRWHARMRWTAEDYFNDKQVILLCHAIEQSNLLEMERLIAAGANANAIGKEGMTPLLWAFPDEKIERFACLLRHGADPNVVIQSDFKTGGIAFHVLPKNSLRLADVGCHPGESITLLAARSPNLDYLKLVLEYRGNPNQTSEKSEEAPLDVALSEFLSDADERVAAPLAKGANPVRYCESRKGYPATEAIEIGRFDVALSLLKAASDRKLNQQEVIAGVSKALVGNEWKARFLKGERAKDRQALVDWLQKNRSS